MGNACCSCAGRPSKKHSSSKSSLQKAERLQNGIEKSPSLKSGLVDKYLKYPILLQNRVERESLKFALIQI